MKINYKTNPILEKLEKGKLGRMLVDPLDIPFVKRNSEKLNNVWAKYCPDFKKDIKFLSNSFCEAFEKAYDKMEEALGDIKFEAQSGTLRMRDFLICYSISAKQEIALFIFDHNTHREEICLVGVYTNEIHFVGSTRFRIHGHPLDREKGDRWLESCVLFLVTALTFIKYGKVETKYIEARKTKKEITCKYINDTDSLIQMIDCRWFTTLVRTEGFGVSGHWRLQPKKKNGEWTKEWIWINEYQKEGYTLPAQKLKMEG